MPPIEIIFYLKLHLLIEITHKPGITPVINVDKSGRFITNPFRANHGNYNNGGRLLWVRRR